LKIQRLPNLIREDKFEVQTDTWNHISDVKDNNFQPLIDKIIGDKMSVNINGRAGTGKSHFINKLIENFEDKNITYKALAYTNKAARIINGCTIHKFIKIMNNQKKMREMDIEYLIIDEISMVPEIFYKYFCIIQRLKPNTKFIIAGDFDQCLPVKDRVENCDYKNAFCLYELVKGNRLELTKCRRSDDTLFNMLLPSNIGNLTPSDFHNQFTSRHITLSNKKRISINQLMMKQEAVGKRTLALDKLPYDPNSQDVKLTKGTPIIARKNAKEYDIFNNEIFTISKIHFSQETITVCDDDDKVVEVPFDKFQRLFYPAYAITIYKSQGSTFDHPYTIHEYNHPRFDNRLKYVCLSRATNIENINILA